MAHAVLLMRHHGLSAFAEHGFDDNVLIGEYLPLQAIHARG